MKITKSNLDLASSYWSLRGMDIYEHPSDWQGEKIFEQLQKGMRNEFMGSEIFSSPKKLKGGRHGPLGTPTNEGPSHSVTFQSS